MSEPACLVWIQVFVCGLAFDFCVFFTAKDAAAAGFKVTFIEDASRAITADGKAAAVAAMSDMGISIVPAALVPTRADYLEAARLAGLGV